MARIWVRSEPFISGAINFPVSNHINANTLKKTVNYARNKGIAGYPKIEYSIWRYIACNKISIPENVAWMYFETFYLVSNIPAEKRIEFDQMLLKCQTDEELEKLKDMKKIDLLQFVLMMYIQQYYSVDLKSSLSAREEWPMMRNEFAGDKRKKALDEINYLNFIIKNLDDLLNLFQFDKTPQNEYLVNDDVLQALDLLFEGSFNNLQTILPLHSLVKQPSLISKFKDGKITLNNLLTIIKGNIEVNPFETSATTRLGKRINVTYSGGSTDPRKAGKIVSNANYAPKSDSMALVTQVVKQTIIDCSESFKDSNLSISRCIYSNIYILAPLRSCTIKKCRKTILFIGVVERTLSIDSCVECTIISVCRRLIIKNCTMCTFYVLTPMNPLILSGCVDLYLAPFNSHYPRIEKHASTCGITPNLNKWDKPIVTSNNNQLTSSSTGIHWMPIPADEFTLFTVPLELSKINDLQTKSMLSQYYTKNSSAYFGKLPFEYEQAIKSRLKLLDENTKTIRQANMSHDQRALLQKVIDNSFKDWLLATGNSKQLEQLTIVSISNQVISSNNNNLTH